VSEHTEADLLDEYVLGTLDAVTSARVAAHVKNCSVCRAELADMRAVIDVLPHALEEATPDSALLQRITAETAGYRPDPARAPVREHPGWFASPLVRALAAGLVLALASDAWLAFRMAATVPQTVASVTPAPVTPAPVTPAPVTPAPATPAPATTSAVSSSRTPAAGATTPDRAAQQRIAALDAELAQLKSTSAQRDARARAQIDHLRRSLAQTGATRIVFVTPAPVAVAAAPTLAPSAAPAPGPSATAAPALVTALRTGRVFAVDGTVANEPWHLTIVQPPDRANALIFSGTPHAPDGQTYRTWVIRDGKTYDAGRLPPAEPTTLEMPMPLQSGDVVAFSREPIGTGDHPTQPFLMKVTISE
jgi:hypothetical protein